MLEQPPYRYLYRGQLEPGQLERHAEPLFRAADYYEITDLKVACERVLTRQLTIRQAQCRDRERDTRKIVEKTF